MAADIYFKERLKVSTVGGSLSLITGQQSIFLGMRIHAEVRVCVFRNGVKKKSLIRLFFFLVQGTNRCVFALEWREVHPD